MNNSNNPKSPDQITSLHDLNSVQEEKLLMLSRLENDLGRKAIERVATLSLPIFEYSAEKNANSVDEDARRELIARQVASIPGLIERYEAGDESFARFVANYAVSTCMQAVENPDMPLTVLSTKLTREELKHHYKEEAKPPKELSSDELDFISTLHRPDKETAELHGIHTTTVSTRAQTIWKRFGLTSRLELIFLAMSKGCKFELPESPDISELTLRERQISSLLHNDDQTISKKLGLTKKQIRDDIKSLYKKTGAINRTELVLMATAYDFGPLPKELKANTPHKALEIFSQNQRDVITKIHLPYIEIANILEISKSAVSARAQNARKLVGTSTNVELCLYLKRRGVKFDIAQLYQRPRDLLTNDQLSVARLAHFQNKQITSMLGMKLTKVEVAVSDAKITLGARTRAELVLMIQEFDDDEPIAETPKSRSEIFFEKLGIDPMSGKELEDLLSHATSGQAKYLREFYFNDENLTWVEIAERNGSSKKSRPQQTADKGIEKIRAELLEQEKRLNNPNYLSPRERELAHELVLTGTTRSDLKNLVESLTKKQKRYIKAYYFSGEEISWASVEDSFGVSRGSASITARKGIERLKDLIG